MEEDVLSGQVIVTNILHLNVQSNKYFHNVLKRNIRIACDYY
jgi:hypothetical protein